MGKRVSFHTLFIEKEKTAFQELQHHLAGIQEHDISTTAFQGDFFELRGSILQWCGPADFTFFFIDPKGWKNVIEIGTLAPLLRRANSEFLINFMYDFVLRTHTQDSFADDIRAIFGEIPDTAGLTPLEKEKCLVGLYLKRLREIMPARGGKPRAVPVPILKGTVDRTLYHLIYLTRHPKGVTVFMEASERSDFVQRRTRAQAKQEKRESRSRQLELFRSADGISKEAFADQAEVGSYWLSKLTTDPKRFGIEELADMIEETGWFESDLQAAFGRLEKEGEVKNLDATGRRRKKFVHFSNNDNKGEFLKKVRP